MRRRALLTGVASGALGGWARHGGYVHSGGGGGLTITGVTLSGLAFLGGSASGTAIGTIGVTTTGGAFSGSLSITGTNASSFQISGTTLETNGVVAAGSYSINIVATQAGATGSPFTQPFTITGTTLPASGTLQAVVTIPDTYTRLGVTQQTSGTYTFNENGTGGTKTVLSPWVDPDGRFTLTRTKVTVAGCLLRVYFMRETSGWASIEFELGDVSGASLPSGNPTWADGTPKSVNLRAYTAVINDSSGAIATYNVDQTPYGVGNIGNLCAGHPWCCGWRTTSETWTRGTKAWPYYRSTATLQSKGLVPFTFNTAVGGGFNPVTSGSSYSYPQPGNPMLGLPGITNPVRVPRYQQATGTGGFGFSAFSDYGVEAFISQSQTWYDDLRATGDAAHVIPIMYRDLATEAIADLTTGAYTNGLALFLSQNVIDVTITNNSGADFIWDGPPFTEPNHTLMDQTARVSSFPGVWWHALYSGEGSFTIPNGQSHTFTIQSVGGYSNPVKLPTGTPIFCCQTSITGAISGGVLTVTGAPSGGSSSTGGINNVLAVGSVVVFSDSTTFQGATVEITAQLTGTPGQTGTYSVDDSSANFTSGGLVVWVPNPFPGVTAAWVANTGQYGGSATVDPSHAPPHSYAAFIITGDPYYLMGLEGQCYVTGFCGYTSMPLTPSPSHPFFFIQIRGGAWSLRDQIQAYQATPVGAPGWIVPQSSKLALTMGIGNGLQWATTSADPTWGGGRTRYFQTSNALGSSSSYVTAFVWQEDYFQQIMAYAAKVLPGTVFESVQDFYSQTITQRFNGTSGWCQSWGAMYHMLLGRGTSSVPQIGPEDTTGPYGAVYINPADAFTTTSLYGDSPPGPLTCGTSSTSLITQCQFDYPPGSYAAAAMHIQSGNARTTPPAWISDMTTAKTYVLNQMLAFTTGDNACCGVKWWYS